MKLLSKTNQILSLALAGALSLSSASNASAASHRKQDLGTVPSTACVEGPVAAAWGGLTLSMWNAVNTDTGETWTFRFDDKGNVKYSRNGGPVIAGTYVQPLRIMDPNRVTVLSSPGAEVGATVPFVVPHSMCTMTWYTSTGPLHMVRT